MFKGLVGWLLHGLDGWDGRRESAVLRLEVLLVDIDRVDIDIEVLLKELSEAHRRTPESLKEIQAELDERIYEHMRLCIKEKHLRRALGFAETQITNLVSVRAARTSRR